MNLRFRVLSAVTLLALFSLPALGQDEVPADGAKNFGPRKGATAGDAGLKTEIVATHGKWQVQCAVVPAQDGQVAGKTCGMMQNAVSEKNEKVSLAVIVNRVKRDSQLQTLMRVMSPIGVYLPTGIPVEIDGAALPNRLVFTRCSPRFCEAFGEASDESLKKFMKGNDSIFYLYDRPGNGYPMKISLEGFAAALDELDKQ
jgi:invasion protein IalB